MDKNKTIVWLQMEYKRAAAMLPLILRRAIILTVVCLIAASIIAFCAKIVWIKDGEGPKLRIGYTAEENVVTNLAVSYVQNMESIQSICSLEAVTEQEGKQLLESGELSALIVLPPNIMNEILSGSNTPATLYLPQKGSGAPSEGGLRTVTELLFEELATAGIGMLGTAQAEIYAVGAVFQELSAEGLQFLYDDINQFNLTTVTGREKLFQTKTLSLTENDTYVVYYGSAFLTVYGLFAGLFFGVFCKRSSLQQTMVAKRIGVGYAAQFVSRCQAGFLLMFVTLLLPFGLLRILLPKLDMSLTIHLTLSGIVGLFLMILFLTVYFMMIYQIVEKRESALVVIGVLAMLQAYLSGCLIPSVLLPHAIATIGKLLPASMVKKGFTMVLTGDAQELQYVVTGLLLWGLLLFLIAVWSMQCDEKRNVNARMHKRRINKKISVPSLGMVLFRRFLHRRSIWLSLFCILVLSAAIMKMEQNAQTQIKVAVYDTSGDFTELLCAYNGLVQFQMYESDAKVRDAVQKGKVECGYILPSMLTDKMTTQKAKREIIVYQDADAVAVPVVNEIIFERIFHQVSFMWFMDYLIQNNSIEQTGMDIEHLKTVITDCFRKEIQGETTFQFEIQRFNTNSQDAENMNASTKSNQTKRTIYPSYLAAIIAVVLCTLQGFWQVIIDLKEQSFYRQNRFVFSMFTLLYPILLGVLCAFLILQK